MGHHAARVVVTPMTRPAGNNCRTRCSLQLFVCSEQ